MRVYTQRPDHNTGNYVPYSLRTVSGFFNVPQSYLQTRIVRRAYGLSSLSENTRKSNYLQMSEQRQHFHVLPFLLHCKFVLTFPSVNEIQKCDHSIESYWAVPFCGVVYFAVQGGSNCWVCGCNSKVWPFRRKLLSSTFLWCCLLRCTRRF